MPIPKAKGTPPARFRAELSVSLEFDNPYHDPLHVCPGCEAYVGSGYCAVQWRTLRRGRSHREDIAIDWVLQRWHKDYGDPLDRAIREKGPFL